MFALSLLSFGLTAEAQPGFVCDTLDMYNIHFRQGRTVIDPNYRSNGTTISIMKRELADLIEYAPRSIESVLVHGYSSPEGRERYNYRLSLRRGKEMQALLRSMPGLSDVEMEIQANGEDWESFVNKVRASYRGANRDLLLKILDSEVSYQLKERWLKILDEDGSTWRMLVDHFMDDSRRASAEVSVRRHRNMDFLPALPAIKSQAAVQSYDWYVEEKSVEPERTRYYYNEDGYYDSETEVEYRKKKVKPQSNKVPKIAFRSNLLVPALNVGMEIPLGNLWSVSTDYYYPWFWPNQRNRNCFEFLGLSLEGRYWFGRDRQPQQRLRGHSLGFYLAAGYYDFEKDYRGMQGEFVSPGLDYTYSVAVGKKKRVNLQFMIGIGYILSAGKTYNVYGDYGALYPDEGTVVWNYIGPTKAAIAISVPLYGKEGRR